MFSYEIKSDFKKDDFLHISCHTFFRYNRYTHINIVSNRYVLYDKDKFIQEAYFLHKNTGDDKINYFSSNFNDFYIKLLNNYKMLKIKLSDNKNDIYKNATIGFRLFDHNGANNIIIKHIKYLSEKFFFFLSIIYMTEIKKYKLNNEEFNYDKKLYIKKTAEKIIGRNISDIELNNIINKKDHRTYTKLIMDYYNIFYNKKNKYCISCLIKKAYNKKIR